MAYAPIKLSSKTTREFWEIPVLFEDDHLLAIAKPALLLTSPDRYDPDRPNLMRLLHDGIAEQKPWAATRGLTYLSNAHRLDFETTGVLLLAKTKPALIALADQFNSEKPNKHYVALAQGESARDKIMVNAAIAPHPIRLGRMRVDTKKGKQSRTEFVVAERFRGYTLFHCRPFTGRTHQLRVHLSYLKLPIVGDGMYGGKPLLLSSLKKRYALRDGAVERPLIGSVALHAEGLSLIHPVTHQRVEIHAPWPKDLTVAVKYLRKHAMVTAPAPVEPAIPSGVIPFVLPSRETPLEVNAETDPNADADHDSEGNVDVDVNANSASADQPGED